MAIYWKDLSIPLKPGMTMWPGDTPFAMEPDGRISRGDNCNTSVLTVPTHTGTHCDAPWHFEDDGKRLHEVDKQLFFGMARLIDVGDAVDLIESHHLGEAPLPERVLIKSRNSQGAPNRPFDTNYVPLSEGAAERLVYDGVRLVGVDYLSVAPYKQSAPVHHILLQQEVFIVEGLCLGELAPGDYPFTVLPLALIGADGSPCRAFAGIERL